MGHGPSRGEIASARRLVLRRVAKDYGGTYVGAGVVGDTWSLTLRLIKASNGEAAFLAQARHGAALATDLDPRAALAAVGVHPKDT